jgi:hypothetical protein
MAASASCHNLMDPVGFALENYDAIGRWRAEADARGGFADGSEFEGVSGLEEALLKDGGSSGELKVQIGSLSLEQGDVAFEATKKLPVKGSFQIAAELREVDSSLHSAQKQQITISELQTAWQAFEPFLQVKALKAEIVPDELRERFHIDSLRLDEPRLMLNPENGPWFEKITAAAEPAMKELPFWKRLGFGSLEISQATARVVVPLADRVEVETAFEVKTMPSGLPQLTVQEARAMIPSRANVPVASLKAALVETKLPEMWREHRVERIDLSGEHNLAADPRPRILLVTRGEARYRDGFLRTGSAGLVEPGEAPALAGSAVAWLCAGLSR